MCVWVNAQSTCQWAMCVRVMLSKKELNGCNACPVHGEPTRSQLGGHGSSNRIVAIGVALHTAGPLSSRNASQLTQFTASNLSYVSMRSQCVQTYVLQFVFSSHVSCQDLVLRD